MGVFVKICGCRSGQDVEAVAARRPDAVGFILWPGSKRYVRPEWVRTWTRDLPATIRKVGVFVNADRDEIREAVDLAGLDVVQLHGEESPDLTRSLSGERWKAIHLNRPLAAPLDAYEVDALLLDHHGGDQPGGTGGAVDWNKAARFVSDAPVKVLLAGGLNPDNVAEAVEQVRPWGVDVSSGVETKDGGKDEKKVEDFIRACRDLE